MPSRSVVRGWLPLRDSDVVGCQPRRLPRLPFALQAPRPKHRFSFWLAAVAFLFAHRYPPPSCNGRDMRKQTQSVVVKSHDSKSYRPSYLPPTCKHNKSRLSFAQLMEQANLVPAVGSER
jgi:hypothetical protein